MGLMDAEGLVFPEWVEHLRLCRELEKTRQAQAQMLGYTEVVQLNWDRMLNRWIPLGDTGVELMFRGTDPIGMFTYRVAKP